MKSWGKAAEALLAGNVIRVPDVRSNHVTGRLTAHHLIRGVYTVKVKTTEEGVVVWLVDKVQTNKGNPYGRPH